MLTLAIYPFASAHIRLMVYTDNGKEVIWLQGDPFHLLSYPLRTTVRDFLGLIIGKSNSVRWRHFRHSMLT
jgi:hypothetical protein